jgi:HlyD family secretion protein
MNRQKIAVITAVLAAIAAGAFFWFRASHGPQGAATIYGNVDIRQVSLAFRVGGRVSEVLVDEGDRVQPGQVLARLDTAPLTNNLRSAEAQLASLTARNTLLHEGFRREDVEQAEAHLQQARAALTEAQTQLKRQQALVPAGAAPQKSLDSAQSQRDQAAAQFKAADAALALSNRGYRKQEIAESDALLQQARANLDTAHLALDDAVLKAPSAAVVLTRSIEKGAMVAVGSNVFGLSLIDPVWVRAYVPEPQLGQFASGAKVSLSTDSRPERPYHGVVGYVSPTAEFTPKSVETTDLRTSLVYRLRVVVQDADEQLRQGMPVTVRLEP